MILRDRDANTNWEAQADATLEERTYTCQNWRADVVALMTSAGVLVNQVRYDPYGKPFGIAKTDLEADGDVDSVDYLNWLAYYSAGTMPFADWNWDGSTDSTDNTAYAADRSADTGIGRGALGYAYSHANGASRKGYAGYEIDPVLTGSEGWESVYHVRYRIYLSQVGQWTRRDPVGYVQISALTLYGYVVHAVLVSLDPTGLHAIEDPLDTSPTRVVPVTRAPCHSTSLSLCLACCFITDGGARCEQKCRDHFTDHGDEPLPTLPPGDDDILPGLPSTPIDLDPDLPLIQPMPDPRTFPDLPLPPWLDPGAPSPWKIVPGYDSDSDCFFLDFRCWFGTGREDWSVN